MWWTIFTAIDLYMGLIIIDAIAGTCPPEKQSRLVVAKKVIAALLAVTGIVLAVQIVKRH